MITKKPKQKVIQESADDWDFREECRWWYRGDGATTAPNQLVSLPLLAHSLLHICPLRQFLPTTVNLPQLHTAEIQQCTHLQYTTSRCELLPARFSPLPVTQHCPLAPFPPHYHPHQNSAGFRVLKTVTADSLLRSDAKFTDLSEKVIFPSTVSNKLGEPTALITEFQ